MLWFTLCFLHLSTLIVTRWIGMRTLEKFWAAALLNCAQKHKYECSCIQNTTFPKTTLQFRIDATLMVNLHWLSPRPGPEQMGYMILCRTFHTAPEQGPEQRRETMGCIHICQVLELFQVVCFNGIQWFSGVQSWSQSRARTRTQTQLVWLHYKGHACTTLTRLPAGVLMTLAVRVVPDQLPAAVVR